MRVALTKDAEGQFDELPPDVRARIRKLFVRLTAWPTVSGAKSLTGVLAGQYRLRTGDYRLQFRVLENVVVIVKIGHRDRFYDR